MENATIITLAPVDTGTEPVTFEEAFGEYSEARGRGRKRRAARRTRRRQARTARKKEKYAERDQRKRAKRDSRIQRRLDRKKKRRLGRQDIRAEKQKRRQERKRRRTEERMSRRELRGRGEEEYDEPLYDDSGYDYEDEMYEEDGYGEDGFDPYEEDYGDDYEDADYGYEDDYDDGYGDDYGSDADYDDYAEDADADYDDWGDDDWGYFDAHMNADGQMTVNPRVQKLTDKIEWNKELVSRLRTRLARRKGSGKGTIKIKQKINDRLDRIQWLEDKLAAFMNNSKGAEQTEFRRRHIGLAKRKSIGERQSLRQRGRGATVVDKELDPKIERDRIEVGPDSNATGDTGLNAIDLQDDYDSPNARVVELTSNADGEKKKFPWKNVLIGVGIAGVIIGGIVLYKKVSKKKGSK